MSRVLRLRWFVLLAAAGLAVWIALYPDDWQFWLGFNQKAYFTTGQNYAFFSGFGAMMMTALGLSTIIVTMIRHFNCHVRGCPRMGKFPVADGQYKVCRKHHGEVTGHPHHLSVEFLHHLHHHGTPPP